MRNRLSDKSASTNTDLKQLNDVVVMHGFGAPTAAGYALGKQLMNEGDDYAIAAAEIVARGLTDDSEQD